VKRVTAHPHSYERWSGPSPCGRAKRKEKDASLKLSDPRSPPQEDRLHTQLSQGGKRRDQPARRNLVIARVSNVSRPERKGKKKGEGTHVLLTHLPHGGGGRFWVGGERKGRGREKRSL